MWTYDMFFRILARDGEVLVTKRGKFDGNWCREEGRKEFSMKFYLLKKFMKNSANLLIRIFIDRPKVQFGSFKIDYSIETMT